MIGRFTTLGVALWSAAACAASGAAQQPTRTTDWAKLSRLPQGSEIRVELAGGRTVRGFLQAATADALSLNATTSQETLPREQVKRVQWKRPGHRGRNTLIGFLAGMGGGLAVGAAIDHTRNDNWFPHIGKAVLTPVGAVIGTVVGVAIPTGRWKDIYRPR